MSESGLSPDAAAALPLRISVAMCTCNGERYLPEQLESLLAQSRPPDEVVVCDDASEDGTVALLEGFRRRAPFRCKVLRNPQRLGYNANFAQAVGLCDGDAIALCDQDDLWYAPKLATLERVFRERPAVEGIFTNGDLIDRESGPLPGDLWSSFSFHRADRVRLAGGAAVDVLIRRNVVTGMAFAFRRRWREWMRRMPPHWPHDSWLALAIAAQGGLAALPEKLVAYRVHGAQQVGVPITRAEKIAFLRERGLDAYRQLSRERNLANYSREARQFESLLAAAAEDRILRDAWWLPLARQKAAHARHGVEFLHERRGLRDRIRLLGRWRKFQRYSSTGVAALFRDLLL